MYLQAFRLYIARNEKKSAYEHRRLFIMIVNDDVLMTVLQFTLKLPIEDLLHIFSVVTSWGYGIVTRE